MARELSASVLPQEPLVAAAPQSRTGILRKAAVVASSLAACGLAAYGVNNGIFHKSETQHLQYNSSPDASRKGSFALNSKPFPASNASLHLRGEAWSEGAIKINEDGVENTYYLPGATIVDDGKTVKYTPPYRFTLMKVPSSSADNRLKDLADASRYYKPQFIGKTISVDVDYGRDGVEPAACGCNVNFYLVDAPVAQPGKDGDYYCDAQCFPNLGCCSEYDMNEMNAAVVQVTNHACAGPYNGHPDWKCHKWGDPETKTKPYEFGVGSGHAIDTKKKFTFSQEFKVESAGLIVTTTLSQGSTQKTYRMGPNSQLDAMMRTGSLERGMAFVTGYWTAPDMNWMDGDTCGQGAEHCNENPVYLGNWRITTNSPAPPAPPSPTPTPGPPAPSGQGKCYWQDCGGHVMDGWCSETADHCAGCGGGVWCPKKDAEQLQYKPLPDVSKKLSFAENSKPR